MGLGAKTSNPNAKKSGLDAEKIELLKPRAEDLIAKGIWEDAETGPYKVLTVQDADLAEVIRRRLANLVGGQVPVIAKSPDGITVSVKKNVLKSAQENLARQTQKD